MIVDTSALPRLTPHQEMEVYCGLDCCVTHEVYNSIIGYLTPESLVSYNFKRAIQAPALEMMLRGIRVDEYHRQKSIAELEDQVTRVQNILDRFSNAVWDRPLNAASPLQLKSLFYEVMQLPRQYKIFRGERKLSTDRDALEKLSVYFHAQPIISCILKVRDLKKKISVLRTEVDLDGRMRTSYNVAGTETDRWSSSSNSTGGGTNLQNITPELRRIFISDPGWKLAYIDLEQAESRAVGWICFTLFGADAYLNACESGDLHTEVSKLVWPGLGWGSDFAENKKMAERPYYRHFSYRDMAKRGGHGTNYYGTPATMARHLKVAVKVMRDFQDSYFREFPEIREYHRWCARHIQVSAQLKTPLGTARHFFGRPNDDATLREGIAYIPQHMVGVLLNLALWRIWYHLPKVQILGQVHDAILLQYREVDEASVLPQAISLMDTPLFHAGREMLIPSEAAVGWNWGKYNDGRDGKPANSDGLLKWKGSDSRKRTETGSGLDRRVS